jgi:hypothetical protein
LFLTACGHEHKNLTAEEMRSIADNRYLVHSKMLGGSAAKLDIPTPLIEVRDDNTHYSYIEPHSHANVLVIVEQTGEVADTHG